MTPEQKQAKIKQLKAIIEWYANRPYIPDTQAERLRRIRVLLNAKWRLEELENL